MPMYPAGVKKLLPESHTQPSITPTQVILHSACNANNADGTYRFFLESSPLESHFLVLDEGGVWQFMDTGVRADANLTANRRPDGTGAISIETDSSVQASEPWTDAQIRDLVALVTWCCREHGIPARLCPTHDAPGIGWHVMFGSPGPWTPVSKVCPGSARETQIRDVILPAVQQALTGGTTGADDMTPDEVTQAVLGAWLGRGSSRKTVATLIQESADQGQVDALAAQVKDLRTKLDQVVELLTGKTP